MWAERGRDHRGAPSSPLPCATRAMSRSATIAATAAALAALAILALRRRSTANARRNCAATSGPSVYKGGRKGRHQYKGGDKSSSGQNFTAWYSERLLRRCATATCTRWRLASFSASRWRCGPTICGARDAARRRHLARQLQLARRALVLDRTRRVHPRHARPATSAIAGPPIRQRDVGAARAGPRRRRRRPPRRVAVALLLRVLPKLKPGALYIVEDVEDPVSFFARERFGSIAAAVADGEAFWRPPAQRQRESTVAAAELHRPTRMPSSRTRLRGSNGASRATASPATSRRRCARRSRRPAARRDARAPRRRGEGGGEGGAPRPTSRCGASSPR